MISQKLRIISQRLAVDAALLRELSEELDKQESEQAEVRDKTGTLLLALNDQMEALSALTSAFNQKVAPLAGRAD